MSDSDAESLAWERAPSHYLSDRPPTHAVPPVPVSHYVTMRDGCRIALDVYLPAGGDRPAAGFPVILILTPYYRRFALREGHAPGTEASPNIALYRDAFVPRGYAVVAVDVRGTGASFGTRDSFRSPVEREDFGEIADWIVAQPWSDGTIGSTGISYLGAAACFLASTGHPAVKAIAPLFAVWNTYTDHLYPGGVLLNRLAESYDEIMVGLDHDRRDILAKLPYFNNPDYAGPHPVDEDTDGTLRDQAISAHRGNFHMPDFISEFRFSDDRLPYDPDFGSHSFNPCHYADGFRPDLAVLSVSGWMDGAGFSNGAIARFLSLPNPAQHLLIGPWDHGGRTNVSPWRQDATPGFPIMAEVLRFFDHYLAGRDAGLRAEAPIHYFTLHAEQWNAARSWPPAGGNLRLYPDAGGVLAEVPGPAGADSFQADFSHGTGTSTRYERLSALAVTEYYPDWPIREARMLSWTTAPLSGAGEIAGHPVINLNICASEADAVLHVYLSELTADGSLHYVTEGVLRALHRMTAPAPPEQNWSWPYRDFSRANSAPLVPGEVAELRFALLPTAWRFARGSRIRLSIAGADSDHYMQLPHGRPPHITIRRGSGSAAQASWIDLPWRPAP
ncbi:MAG: CocE/NonD family hydrolase [Rhodobacteraceae bacterium]|nr:CocE/NonD family hydrolase [Paracoccaceae bacterium]